MKDIVQTSSGAVWREVETIEEGNAIGEATNTAFGYFFRSEQQRSQNRYFALGDDFKVIGCVPRAPAPCSGSPAHGVPLFVGHRNTDPFRAYEQELAELGQAIGVEIMPVYYPYRDAGLDQSIGDAGSPSPDA